MLRTAILVFALSMTAGVTSALASEDPWVRFYKINKKGQQRHLEFTRGTREEGCHNFFKSKKVHRVAQVRYAHCKVYTEKDCRQGSEAAARWEGTEDPTTVLTPGSQWVLREGYNVKLRSWECVKP